MMMSVMMMSVTILLMMIMMIKMCLPPILAFCLDSSTGRGGGGSDPCQKVIIHPNKLILSTKNIVISTIFIDFGKSHKSTFHHNHHHHGNHNDAGKWRDAMLPGGKRSTWRSSLSACQPQVLNMVMITMMMIKMMIMIMMTAMMMMTIIMRSSLSACQSKVR